MVLFVIFYTAFFSAPLIADVSKSSFILKTTKTSHVTTQSSEPYKSKNDLREELVRQSKKTLDASVGLTQTIAQLQDAFGLTQATTASKPLSQLKSIVGLAADCQQETARLLSSVTQFTRLSSSVAQAIIEEQKVFKKAGKKELTAAHGCLLKAEEEIYTTKKDIDQALLKKAHDINFAQIKKKLQTNSVQLSKAYAACKDDTCLKEL